MNIETGEVRDVQDLTPRELASGKWIKLPKAYHAKTPLSDADRRRVIASEAKRLRKRARSLAKYLALPSEDA